VAANACISRCLHAKSMRLHNILPQEAKKMCQLVCHKTEDAKS